jgi:hypothetical protein
MLLRISVCRKNWVADCDVTFVQRELCEMRIVLSTFYSSYLFDDTIGKTNKQNKKKKRTIKGFI